MKLTIFDDENISIQTNVHDLKLPLQKDEQPITSLYLEGKITPNFVTLNTLSNDLKVDVRNGNTSIIVNGYDVVYKSSDEGKYVGDLNVRLIDSDIHIDEKESFYSIDSDIRIFKDKVMFDGMFGDLDIPLSKDGKYVTFLDLEGSYENKEINIQSKDNRVKIKIIDEKELIVDLNDIDLRYDTEEDEQKRFKSLKATATNSNIIINDKFKVLAQNYQFFSNQDKTHFELKYKNAKVTYSKMKMMR